MSKGPSTQVLVVEDHEMVRGLLCQLVGQIPEVEVCGAAATAEEALEMIDQRQPDVLLVDISLPQMDGIQLIELVSTRWPEIRCLAISGHDESVYARTAIKAGARGYIMKGKARQINKAISEIMNGNLYVSEQIQSGGNGAGQRPHL